LNVIDYYGTPPPLNLFTEGHRKMDQEKYPHSKVTEKIIGLAFELFKELGAGYSEKVYQKGLEEKFKKHKLNYRKELNCSLLVEGKKIGGFRVDFLVEDVVVELKARGAVISKDISQVLTYLKVHNIKVGLLLIFTKNGVKIKRLIL